MPTGPQTDEEFAAWHAQMMRSIKGLFVLIFVVEIASIVLLIWEGYAMLLSGPITGLLIACIGRWVIYMRDHGWIGQ